MNFVVHSEDRGCWFEVREERETVFLWDMLLNYAGNFDKSHSTMDYFFTMAGVRRVSSVVCIRW